MTCKIKPNRIVVIIKKRRELGSSGKLLDEGNKAGLVNE